MGGREAPGAARKGSPLWGARGQEPQKRPFLSESIARLGPAAATRAALSRLSPVSPCPARRKSRFPPRSRRAKNPKVTLFRLTVALWSRKRDLPPGNSAIYFFAMRPQSRHRALFPAPTPGTSSFSSGGEASLARFQPLAPSFARLNRIRARREPGGQRGAPPCLSGEPPGDGVRGRHCRRRAIALSPGPLWPRATRAKFF
jgi:hypothetical protein